MSIFLKLQFQNVHPVIIRSQFAFYYTCCIHVDDLKWFPTLKIEGSLKMLGVAIKASVILTATSVPGNE